MHYVLSSLIKNELLPFDCDLSSLILFHFGGVPHLTRFRYLLHKIEYNTALIMHFSVYPFSCSYAPSGNRFFEPALVYSNQHAQITIHQGIEQS